MSCWVWSSDNTFWGNDFLLSLGILLLASVGYLGCKLKHTFFCSLQLELTLELCYDYISPFDTCSLTYYETLDLFCYKLPHIYITCEIVVRDCHRILLAESCGKIISVCGQNFLTRRAATPDYGLVY